MKFSSVSLALFSLGAICFPTYCVSTNTCQNDVPYPINAEDFGEPSWEDILELAFPTWDAPANGCARLDMLEGSFVEGYGNFTNAVEGKFNPCYYTKAFAGLDPMLGGYPTPIDTLYPYEFAAPFFGQPGDGSTHHCPLDSKDTVPIGSCPKVKKSCGPDCVDYDDNGYGYGHFPPFVPLAAVKNAYNDCSKDACEWFDFDTSGCNIPKSKLDELTYESFGVNGTIQFQPPILIDGVPSSTYYRLEYLGESPACDDGNCRGPHYCSKEAADADIWGDFCPYVHTGENSGLYRHPHLALAALELWIANKCMPEKCPSKWLDSPAGQEYGSDKKTSTSITWSEMIDNSDPMSQPIVPYQWPNAGDGLYPGKELYDGKRIKPAAGSYVTELVALPSADPDPSGAYTPTKFVTLTAIILVGIVSSIL